MQTDAIFRIASQSKAIVSVAAMTLVEEGKLLLDGPRRQILAGIHGDEGRRSARRRHGLRRRQSRGGRSRCATCSRTRRASAMATASAATCGPRPDKRVTTSPTRTRRSATPCAASRACPHTRSPARTWIYGYNTDILGALVEVVAGKPLDRVLSERIFEPLGMRDTEFYLSPGKENRLTAVYSRNDGRLERAPAPGNAVGQGHYVDGPRKNFLRRRGAALDGHRLRALPADDAERRHARRPAHLEPQDRRAHDDEPSRRHRLQRRARVSVSASTSSKTSARAARRDRKASSAGAARTTRPTGSIRARSSSSCT